MVAESSSITAEISQALEFAVPTLPETRDTISPISLESITIRLIICCRVSKNTLMPPASCPISSLFFKEILRVRSPLPDSISFKISFSCVVTLLTGFTTVRTDPITATTKNTSTSTNVTPLTARELLYTDSCSATPASTFASIYPSSSVSTPSTFSLVGASTVLQICLALSLFPREIKSAIRS